MNRYNLFYRMTRLRCTKIKILFDICVSDSNNSSFFDKHVKNCLINVKMLFLEERYLAENYFYKKELNIF